MVKHDRDSRVFSQTETVTQRKQEETKRSTKLSLFDPVCFTCMCLCVCVYLCVFASACVCGVSVGLCVFVCVCKGISSECFGGRLPGILQPRVHACVCVRVHVRVCVFTAVKGQILPYMWWCLCVASVFDSHHASDQGRVNSNCLCVISFLL